MCELLFCEFARKRKIGKGLATLACSIYPVGFLACKGVAEKIDLR